jgi:hypothetical protein
MLLAVQAVYAQAASTTSTGVVSPSVVATTIVEYPSDARADLQLLVLWRGKPGWFTAGDPDGRSGRSSWAGSRTGPRTPYMAEARYGSISLGVTLLPETRVATIGPTEVSLGHDNVILVDRVDLNGGAVVETLYVDPVAVPRLERHTPRPFIEPQEFIRRSARLRAYLQCDTTLTGLSDKSVQQMMKMLCLGVQERR